MNPKVDPAVTDHQCPENHTKGKPSFSDKQQTENRYCKTIGSMRRNKSISPATVIINNMHESGEGWFMTGAQPLNAIFENDR
jgi:hypothetical protein